MFQKLLLACHNTPTLIIKDGIKSPEVFLVIEKGVLCRIPCELAPIYLLAAFYVFNSLRPDFFL